MKTSLAKVVGMFTVLSLSTAWADEAVKPMETGPIPVLKSDADVQMWLALRVRESMQRYLEEQRAELAAIRQEMQISKEVSERVTKLETQLTLQSKKLDEMTLRHATDIASLVEKQAAAETELTKMKLDVLKLKTTDEEELKRIAKLEEEAEVSRKERVLLAASLKQAIAQKDMGLIERVLSWFGRKVDGMTGTGPMLAEVVCTALPEGTVKKEFCTK